jgi:hypothetical protein
VRRDHSRRRSIAGFIITAELLLILGLFVVPLFVGGILVFRKMVTLYLDRRDYAEIPYSRAVVWDSTMPTPKVVGPVLGYDNFEAPLVLFRDDSTKSGVILGVRTDRFTSYGQVFYTDSGCSSNAQVRAYNTSVGTGATAPDYLYGPDGFVYQMQGVSYAMGNGNILYRAENATGTNVTSDGTNLFVWNSQDIGTNTATAPYPPCYSVANGVTVENLAPANVVIDFDSAYQYPYRAAFPTPQNDTSLTCSSGEC